MTTQKPKLVINVEPLPERCRAKIEKQAAELDRLRALLMRWVDASVWNMTELERETKRVLNETK